MLTLLLVVSLQAAAPGDWPAYGRDPGGARFSPLTQITRAKSHSCRSRGPITPACPNWPAWDTGHPRSK